MLSATVGQMPGEFIYEYDLQVSPVQIWAVGTADIATGDAHIAVCAV